MNGSVPFESPRKRLCFRGDLRFFGLGYPPCGRRNDAQASAAACHSERNVLPVIRSGILALSFRADCHSCHSEERSDEESWRPLEGGKLSALLCGLKGVQSQPPPPPNGGAAPFIIGAAKAHALSSLSFRPVVSPRISFCHTKNPCGIRRDFCSYFVCSPFTRKAG